MAVAVLASFRAPVNTSPQITFIEALWKGLEWGVGVLAEGHCKTDRLNSLYSKDFEIILGMGETACPLDSFPFICFVHSTGLLSQRGALITSFQSK